MTSQHFVHLIKDVYNSTILRITQAYKANSTCICVYPTNTFSVYRLKIGGILFQQLEFVLYAHTASALIWLCARMFTIDTFIAPSINGFSLPFGAAEGFPPPDDL